MTSAKERLEEIARLNVPYGYDYDNIVHKTHRLYCIHESDTDTNPVIPEVILSPEMSNPFEKYENPHPNYLKALAALTDEIAPDQFVQNNKFNFELLDVHAIGGSGITHYFLLPLREHMKNPDS